MSETSGLFLGALFAFLAMPAVVAFLVPWLILSGGAHFDIRALPVVIVGLVLLLWCVRDFYVAGRGTLAPWAPPKHLVTVGLYQISRNPMYLAVLTIITGWAIGFRSPAIAVYAGFMAIAFYVRVRFFEEEWLANTFGSEWTAYRARVSRWLGRRS